MTGRIGEGKQFRTKPAASYALKRCGDTVILAKRFFRHVVNDDNHKDQHKHFALQNSRINYARFARAVVGPVTAQDQAMLI